jgi:hydroxymethylbilane synthase
LTVSLRLGTRGSALALWQANWTRAALETRFEDLAVEIVKIQTTGDRVQDVGLADVGGKGLFTKELDDALADGRIDMAVHSLKDLPFELPEGLELAAVSQREDPRDAIVSSGPPLRSMFPRARIGTSSLRRQAQLRARFPALDPVMLRGNVDTRLRKLDAGNLDAIVVAAAGLKRLGHAGRITEFLDPKIMLPAIGQGALALVCRAGNGPARDALSTLDHAETRLAVSAERALMAALEGSCRVPIAGYAVVEGDRLWLRGLIAALDGATVVSDSLRGSTHDAEQLGRRLGEQLRSAGGDQILAGIHAARD